MGYENVKEILDRLREHFLAESFLDLAQKTGWPLGTIDTWKAKKRIPAYKLMRLAKEQKINLEWIKTGTGEKYMKNIETSV